MFSPRNQYYNRFKSLKGSIITVEGIIGVGKTTLGKTLEAFLNEIGLNAKFYPEYVNKMLLDQYIQDMKKYAYTFQMIMLCKRIEIYREAERFSSTGGIAIIDRSIIGDMTFAKMQKDNGNFTDQEWDTYISLMKQEIQLSPYANIYLKCSPATSLQRIKNRGIDSEISGYSYKYIEQLHQSYEKSIEEAKVNNIILDWNCPSKYIDGRLDKNIILFILNLLLTSTDV